MWEFVNGGGDFGLDYALVLGPSLGFGFLGLRFFGLLLKVVDAYE